MMIKPAERMSACGASKKRRLSFNTRLIRLQYTKALRKKLECGRIARYMPIIKSAIKKLRQDKKRTKINRVKKDSLKDAIKKALKTKKEVDVKGAISAIDKAAKKHLIHKNKAARLKSRVAKLISFKAAPKKTTAPKAPVKKKK